MSKKQVMKLDNVSKIYHMDEVEVRALDSVSLTVEEGEFVVLSGPSGSGKSTLLNLIGCIDKPSLGNIFFNEKDITDHSLEELNELRLKNLGFIYQSFNLIPVLTAYENVELPLIFKSNDSQYIQDQVENTLEMVGLSDRSSHRPGRLSGGQRQRVAIARALAGKPTLIIADEPTANLDSVTSHTIMDLMLDLNQKSNVTMIIASHDPIVIEKAQREIVVRDGKVINHE